MKTLVIRQNRFINLLYFIGAAIFAVGGGYWAISDGDLYGWLGLTFFGAAAIFYLWQYFDTKPQIVINDDGICDFNSGYGCFLWADIERIFTVPLIPNVIFIELFEPQKYLDNFSPLGQKMIKIDTAAMPSKFRVNLMGMNVRRKKVFQIISENLEIYRKFNNRQITESKAVEQN